MIIYENFNVKLTLHIVFLLP